MLYDLPINVTIKMAYTEEIFMKIRNVNKPVKSQIYTDNQEDFHF